MVPKRDTIGSIETFVSSHLFLHLFSFKKKGEEEGEGRERGRKGSICSTCAPYSVTVSRGNVQGFESVMSSKVKSKMIN
jgi:hypothetical protein